MKKLVELSYRDSKFWYFNLLRTSENKSQASAGQPGLMISFIISRPDIIARISPGLASGRLVKAMFETDYERVLDEMNVHNQIQVEGKVLKNSNNLWIW